MFCVPLHSLSDSLLHSFSQCSPTLSFHVPQTLKCLWLTFLSGSQTKPTANPRWLSEFHHLCYLIPAPQDMWPKGFGSLLADLASSGPIVDDSQYSTVRGSPPCSDPSCDLSCKLVFLAYKSVTVSHLIPTHTVLATPLSPVLRAHLRLGTIACGFGLDSVISGVYIVFFPHHSSKATVQWSFS